MRRRGGGLLGDNIFLGRKVHGGNGHGKPTRMKATGNMFRVAARFGVVPVFHCWRGLNCASEIRSGAEV